MVPQKKRKFWRKAVGRTPPQAKRTPTVNEFVWTWNGHQLRHRKRKHVDKEIRDAERMAARGVTWRRPIQVFESEAAGVVFVIPLKRADVADCEKKLKRSKADLARWVARVSAEPAKEPQR